MTESTGNFAHPAGWYADPAGSPRQRWWDGTRWTEDLHDPSLEVYGVVAPSILGPGTPVYNVFIWVIVLLPIVSLVDLLSTDFTAAFAESVSDAQATFDPGNALSQLVSWLIFGGTVVLAYFDRRRLIRDGFERPFHWAWAFLSGVYVIGRAVIVRRRAGRGLAPMWVWVGLVVVSFVIAAVKISEAMSVVMPGLLETVPG